MYAVAARAPCIPSIPCPPTLFQLFVHFYRWLSFARYVARANGFLVAEMRSSTPRRDSQVLNFERCFPTRSNGSSNVTRIQHAIAWLGFSGFNRKYHAVCYGGDGLFHIRWYQAPSLPLALHPVDREELIGSANCAMPVLVVFVVRNVF